MSIGFLVWLLAFMLHCGLLGLCLYMLMQVRAPLFASSTSSSPAQRMTQPWE